jgi:hypothetical protein
MEEKFRRDSVGNPSEEISLMREENVKIKTEQRGRSNKFALSG